MTALYITMTMVTLLVHFNTEYYCSNSRISLMPVKNCATIWNSVTPIVLVLARVKLWQFWVMIAISCLLHKLFNILTLLASFGRSSIVFTWRPEPMLVGFRLTNPSFSCLVKLRCFCNSETKDWRRPTAALTFPLLSWDFSIRCSEWLIQATRSLFLV